MDQRAMAKINRIITIMIVFSIFFNFIFIFSDFDNSVSAYCPCDYIQVYSNEYGRIEVYPKTCGNFITQKQYWNFTSNYTTNIDIAFKFNNSISNGGVYLWNNQSKKYNKLDFEHIIFNNSHFYVSYDLSVQAGKTYYGFWNYDTPVNSSGKWELLIKRSVDPIGVWRMVLDPYWDTDYKGRYDLYIDKDQVDTTQNNFPVWIEIKDNSELYGKTQNDLDDIVFVNSANDTVLNYELVEYSKSGGVVNAHYFVNITTINSSGDNTHINLYYNNPSALNQSDPENTWDSDYFMVHHFEETDIDGGMNEITDSTKKDNDGTTYNMDGNDDVSAQIGTGFEFDGVNDYIIVPYDNSMDVDQVTAVSYVKTETLGGDSKGRIYTKRDHTKNRVSYGLTTIDLSGFDMYGAQYYDENGNSDVVEDTDDISFGEYYTVASTFDTSYDGKLYINGLLNATFTTWNADIDVSTDDLIIGSEGEFLTTRNYEGVIDELFLSDGVRSKDYIETQHNNFVNDSDATNPFVIWGSYHYYGEEIVVSNVFPADNSYWCYDVTTLNKVSVDVNLSLGVRFYINITINNYTKVYNNVYNGTFYINITNIIPYGTTNISWYINISSSVCVDACFYNASYSFDVCWDALIYLQNKGGDTGLIEFDTVQFALFIEIIMFTIFLWIGFEIEKNYEHANGKAKAWKIIPMSYGLFQMFGSVALISMGATLSVYLNSIFATFIVIAGIVLLIYSIVKAFYYANL